MEDLLSKIWVLLTIYGLKVIAAIAVFIVGRWIAKMLTTLTEKVMNKRQVDPTIISFVANLIYIAFLVFVVLAALGQLGIQTTSFIAVIGAAGLAIGLALQGSLSNFAAGFLMIIFRPFKVGDFIEGAGVAGTVEAIHIFTTQLLTPDNKTIIIPNASLTAGNITNYSAKGTRRVDLVIGIGYGDDVDHAKKVISDVLTKEERILKDPAPTIMLKELADSSVNFAVRPWVLAADYWGVYSALNENIKKSFDVEGISIPFPQRDVHVYKHEKQ
ncbi:MAG: mechanosensitive ion channel [Thermodesulfobacteriota bacterium]|nr:MAG: mechanosensitive ion channel [Thermodesulfobacteriota bacterium]